MRTFNLCEVEQLISMYGVYAQNWIVYSYFRADRASRTELNSIVFYEDAVSNLPWSHISLVNSIFITRLMH